MRAVQGGDEDSYRIYMKRRDAVKAAYDLAPSETNPIRERLFKEVPVDKSIDERMQKWNRKHNLFKQE